MLSLETAKAFSPRKTIHLHLLSRNRPGWRMAPGFFSNSLMPSHTGWPMVPKLLFRIRVYCSWGGTFQRCSSNSRPL